MPQLTEYPHSAAAADYIGVSQNTIPKLEKPGDIPMHRDPTSGYRLVKQSVLDAFLGKIEKPTNNPR